MCGQPFRLILQCHARISMVDRSYVQGKQLINRCFKTLWASKLPAERERERERERQRELIFIERKTNSLIRSRDVQTGLSQNCMQNALNMVESRCGSPIYVYEPRCEKTGFPQMLKTKTQIS